MRTKIIRGYVKMKMNIDVVGFVNEGRAKKHDELRPILVKLAFFTAMITLAVMLTYTKEFWVGYVIYAKEVVEFILFIWFLRRHK